RALEVELAQWPRTVNPADPETAAQRDRITATREFLQVQYREADMERRIDLTLTGSQTNSPDPKTRWEKLLTFFISRGMFASLQKGGRILTIVVLFILMLSFIGIQIRTRRGQLADFPQKVSVVGP